MARPSPKSNRPDPITVGVLRARVHVGPHPDDAGADDRDRRWKWRVFRGEEALGMLGWLAPNDVAREIAHRWTLSSDDATPSVALSGTIGALIEAYVAHMEARADVAKATKRNVRTKGKHITAGLGAVRAGSITEDVIQTYVNRRLAASAASTSVSSEVKVLRMAWTWGGKPGRSLCPARPLPRIRMLVRAERPYTPKDADIRALAAALPLECWPRLFVEVAFETGMRLHEIARLRWNEVDLDRGEIVVPADTKTGARVVALDEDGIAIFQRWGSIGGHDVDSAARVFPVSENNVSSHVGEILRNAAIAIGMEPFTPHGIRRAVVRRFRRAGIHVSEAAAHFGHAPAVMLSVYDSIDDDDRNDVRARLRAFKIEERTKDGASQKSASSRAAVTRADA